ncbi:hypothetical protein [Bythopirellula polymerisocia]|uniref:Uncharacterized protein n=1 Tax=Bythopirellula polymerisocia TaxID=2528003 RepID=A0A5C6CBL1_9BACT|nr:hypothetical protein [Bythopirellula polymerisocia]TWU20821.1 hypothetical protein Pla144_48740 [Bythopirellula polymerisocia]
MTQFFSGLDPTLVLCLFVPAALIFAAWTLQIACAFAAVETPNFWQCLLCTLLVVVANILLRFWVNTSVVDPGLGTNLLAPVALTISIVAVMVRTSPLSALVITTCQGLVFTGLYMGLSMLNSTLSNVI